MNWRIRGFMNNRSTTDIILLIKSLIINNKANNKKTFIGFMDIKGAYDNVDYRIVALALKEFGFCKNQGKGILNILKNHQFCLEIQGELTKSVRRNIGLPQGDPMAPILFNLVAWAIIKRFIVSNNLREGYADIINEIAILSYADDFTLLADNYNKLKDYFISIKSFFNSFGLELDPKKSDFVTNSLSRKKTMEIEANWVINRQNNVEILGYYVFENRAKRIKQENIVNRIRLLASFLPLKYIQPYRLNLIINSKLLSKISYLCRGERFKPNLLNRIDVIIRSCIKTKAGLDKQLSTDTFYKDLNDGGFGLTKAEKVANNCYISSFFCYINNRSKPLRRMFEDAYFNSFGSKSKDYFYEIYKITRPFHLRQGKCDTRKKVSKIGKFTHFNVFTDGSCCKGWAGGGVHIRGHRNGKIRLFNRRINFRKGSNNKGEILSIIQALMEIPRNSSVNIFTDSNVALGALNNKKYKGKFEIVSRTFKKIVKHKRLNLNMIKVDSHCGVKGNDVADALAKEGCLSPNLKEIEEYISKTYSFLIKEKQTTDENNYNPEPIYNLYTWNGQFKIKTGCSLTGLWMRYNVGSPMCKYRYIGYRNEGLIEYKYGETKMKCSICKRTRTAKHCLEDCICVKEQIDKCEQPLLKAINSRGMLDKIKFESFGFKFDFLSYTITMASNNTRFIGRDEINRKLKTKENKRFNKKYSNLGDELKELLIENNKITKVATGGRRAVICVNDYLIFTIGNNYYNQLGHGRNIKKIVTKKNGDDKKTELPIVSVTSAYNVTVVFCKKELVCDMQRKLFKTNGLYDIDFKV
ncbi:hypothetical protein ABK040_009149 [Willaertia magna]